MANRISILPLTWETVKERMESEGSLNVRYDPNKDGIIAIEQSEANIRSRFTHKKIPLVPTILSYKKAVGNTRHWIGDVTLTDEDLCCTILKSVPDAVGKVYFGIMTDDNKLLETTEKRVHVDGVTGKTNIYDYDDATFGHPATLIAAGEKREVMVWDLGSIAERLLFFKIYSNVWEGFGRIYWSNDDITYTLIHSTAGLYAVEHIDLISFFGAFRYLKWEVENKRTAAFAGDLWRLYSHEAYTLVHDIEKDFLLTWTGTKRVCLISHQSVGNADIRIWKEASV